ncbi:isoleucine--tRNA ligase [Buchananella hordeovulneris]|uniref:Isoleucine--tRNA ligase n=1 Tax=Buchananella hordeovulneris TaxID=52770 RepID=A0A1Q5PX23_9ACTO|nr:isoleucine--tRNA ligase [Buchananella hordeovulneris]OKL52107.1 isoleucine--tRNA ligase [Buchananella hordeovulneris]
MTQGHYPLHRAEPVVSSPSFPALEKEVLAYWEKDKTFEASVEQRPAGPDGSNEFVFYDGPPFANGLPHYGHLLTGYAKDLVARFRTQRGQRVERRFGWDTHGLPAELEAERILGIEDKSQIDGEGGIGIAAFNDACRSSVLRYTDEWERYVTRQARWVDFPGGYRTLDLPYMESVIWAFKQLYDKGLAYEGHRVLPYCWNDQTPLSNHELKMDDDVYQDRQDNTVTVGLRLESGELALIWTTTPWTLPSNSAIAVGPEIDYVVVVPRAGALAGERVLLAEALVGAYQRELGEDPEVVKRLTGAQLAGRRYAPIFDYFDTPQARAAGAAPGPEAFQIITADFVTTEDGTGLVHLAPAFGEDDMQACFGADIGTVIPVDDAGKFTTEVSDYAGQHIFAANKHIIRDLRDGTGPLARRAAGERAVLVRQASYVHAYPHCWRCRQPLIYRAVGSWFVAVTKIRDRMVELNQEISWVPSHLRDGQFGKWLENARDWSISRNRFWGAPIPVWVSDNPDYPRVDVYGSLAELEADFGVEVHDLHRPFIDTLTRPNPDDPTGQSTMRRIPDVLDCWFESGSMPFAQVHYPFENRDWFEDHYPGDFITEYIGQTRGWFYTLHVLATALFDRPAFCTSVSHGIVLGDDGRKMSKSLRNYPDVNEVFDRDGADAMRWFLMSSNILRGGNLVVTADAIRDAVRRVLLPLWNTWYFYSLYAGTVNGGAGYVSPGVQEVEGHLVAADGSALPRADRYVLARTRDLADTVGAQLEAYDIMGATQTVEAYLDVLTNWYVRTSRQRFWDEDLAAFDTLRTCLEVLVKVMASLAPLVSEEIYRGLTGERSVHLTDWPVLSSAYADDALVVAMDEVRDVVSAALALRKAEQVRVRQPLRLLDVISPHPERLAPFTELIASEVNVRQVRVRDVEGSGMAVVQNLTVNPRELDPAKRKLTSQLFAAVRAGEWELVESESGPLVRFGGVHDGGAAITLAPGEYTLTTAIDAPEGQAATALGSGAFVLLDTSLDDDLRAEGAARDLVRAIQDARKAADLHVADRIRLELTVPADVYAAAQRHQDMLASECLATEVEITEGEDLEVKVAKL